jgi:hypothetical protein
LRTYLSLVAHRTLPLLVLALVFPCLISGPAATAQASVSIPEEIEWTWEVRPTNPDPKLPNVLLLGDSIARNYFPQVVKDLTGIANVYLMAVSTSVGDPRLPHQIAEFATMENLAFRVVHFNNGMHGWGYNEAQYKAAFPALLSSVRRLTDKGGRLIWANTTPVRPDALNGATNPRIEERNAVAEEQVRAAGISIDDQHTLMTGHPDLYQDAIHFGPRGADIMGDHAAATIRSALNL